MATDRAAEKIPAPDPASAPVAGREVRLDDDNPWPSLDAFTENATRFFKGRDGEIQEMHRRVQRGIFTVLYGVSGLGKTSLVQAGLFPRLRQNGFMPVRIRLDHVSRTREDLVEQVREELRKALAGGRYQAQRGPDPGESLWSYFHQPSLNITDRENGNRPVSVVLVFDQFEEIFTQSKGDPSHEWSQRALVETFYQLFSNQIPTELKRELERNPEAINRYDFDEQDYRVVLSFREEYLPHVESLCWKMPGITENRIRLLPLTEDQALQAVQEPGRKVIEPEVARQVVQFVAGESGNASAVGRERTVNPALLSLIASELNVERKDNGAPRITSAQVTKSASRILERFYDRCFKGLKKEEHVRRIIEEKLLAGDNLRERISVTTLQAELQAEPEPGFTSDEANKIIKHLEDTWLVQLDTRSGRTSVELTHDILTGVVAAEKTRRKQADKLAEEQRIFKKLLDAADARRKQLRVRAAIVVLCGLIVVGAFALGNFWKINAALGRKTQEAHRYLADYLLEKVNGALSVAPPNSHGAALLWQKAMADTNLYSNIPQAGTIGAFIQPPPLRYAGTLRIGEPLQQMGYSPDGAVLAILTTNGRLQFLDSGTGELSSWPAAGNPPAFVQSFTFSPVMNPTQSVVAIRTSETNIARWDWKTRTSLVALTITNPASAGFDRLHPSLPILFSPDGGKIAVARSDASIQMVRAEPTGKAVNGAVPAVEVASNTRRISNARQKSPLLAIQPEIKAPVRGSRNIPNEPDFYQQRALKYQPPIVTSVTNTPAMAFPSQPSTSLCFMDDDVVAAGAGDGYWFWRTETMRRVAVRDGDQTNTDYCFKLTEPIEGNVSVGASRLSGAVWLFPWSEVQDVDHTPTNRLSQNRSLLGADGNQNGGPSGNAAREATVVREGSGPDRSVVIKIERLRPDEVPSQTVTALTDGGENMTRLFYALRNGFVQMRNGSEVVQELRSYGNAQFLALRPDGVLAAGLADGRLKFWAPIHPLERETSDYFSFSSDASALGHGGQYWARASISTVSNRTVDVLVTNLETGLEFARGHISNGAGQESGYVAGLAVDAKGRLRVALRKSEEVAIWELLANSTPRQLPTNFTIPEGGRLQMSSDGRRIAILGPQEELRVHDVESGNLLKTLRLQDGSDAEGRTWRILAFNHDANQLASLNPKSGVLEMFDLDRDDRFTNGWKKLLAPLTSATALAFSADGRALIFGSSGGEIAIMAPGTGAENSDKILLKIRIGDTIGSVLTCTNPGIVAVSGRYGGNRILRGWESSADLKRQAQQELRGYTLVPSADDPGSPLDLPALDAAQVESRRLTKEFGRLLEQTDAHAREFSENVREPLTAAKLADAIAPLRAFMEHHPKFNPQGFAEIRKMLEGLPPWPARAPTPDEAAARMKLVEVEDAVAVVVLREGLLPYYDMQSPEGVELRAKLAEKLAEWINRADWAPDTGVQRCRSEAEVVELIRTVQKSAHEFPEDATNAFSKLGVVEFVPQADLKGRAHELLGINSTAADVKAGRFLHEAIKASPDDPGVLYALGVVLARTEQYSEAVATLELAARRLDMSQSNDVAMLPRVLLEIARCHEARGQLQPALDKLNAAVGLTRKGSSEQADVLQFRGAFQARGGLLREAIADFDAALEAGSSQPEIRLRRARARLELGDANPALDDLDALAGYARTNADIRARIGEVLLDAFQLTNRVVEHFSEAMLLAPGNPDFVARRGFMHARLNHKDDAVFDLNRAVRLSPEDWRLQLQYGRALFALGDVEGALVRWQQAEKLAIACDLPESSRLLATLAMGYWRAGQRDQALACYRRLVARCEGYRQSGYINRLEQFSTLEKKTLDEVYAVIRLEEKYE